MSAGFGWAALARRQLRADRGPALVLALMVGVVAAIAAATPATMAAIAGDEIRSSVTSLAPNSRDLMLRANSTVGFGAAPDGVATDLPEAARPVWGALAADLAAARDRFPEQVRRVADPGRILQTSSAQELAPAQGQRERHFVALADDPYLTEHLALAQGRLPRAPDTAPDPGTGFADLSVVEVALGSAAAARLDWTLGTDRTLAGQPSTLRLVGLLDDTPVDPDYPRISPFALQANVFDDGDRPVRVTGTAYVADRIWPILSVVTGSDGAPPPSLVLWFGVQAAPVSGASLESLAADLRRLTVLDFPVTGAQDSSFYGQLSRLRFTTELPATLDAARGRVTSASAVQLVAALGPAGAAVAVLTLGLQAFVRRRRATHALLVARGASFRQLRWSAAAQGAVMGLPSAVLAAVGVSWAFGGSTPWWAPVLALIAGLVPAAAFVAALSPARLREARSDLGMRGGSRVRRVVEVAVLALAALSLYLLLAGGLTAGSGGADVLVAAAPVFLTLAVCVLVIRLYPLPLLVLQRTLRGRRGAVGYLGVVRSLRDPSVGVPLILACVTGVAVAVFSVTTLSTIQRGIDDAAARSVGADLVMTGGYVVPAVLEQVRATTGVETATAVGSAGAITLSSSGGAVSADLYYVDSSTFAAVQRDIPGAPDVPTALGAPDRTPVPIVVSDGVASRLSGPATLDGTAVSVAGRGAFPAGLGSRQDWVIVDLSRVADLDADQGVFTTLLVRFAAGADRQAVQRTLAEKIPRVPGALIVDFDGVPTSVLSFRTPDQAAEALRAAPTIAGMREVLMAVTALGVVLVALAVIVTAVAGSRARNRLLAVLRLLGLDGRQVTRLAAWEQTPPALTAVVVGGGFGIVLAALVGGVVDLRAFTGDVVRPELAVEAWPVAQVVGGFLAVIAVAIAIAAVLARRSSAATLMRVEE